MPVLALFGNTARILFWIALMTLLAALALAACGSEPQPTSVASTAANDTTETVNSAAQPDPAIQQQAVAPEQASPGVAEALLAQTPPTPIPVVTPLVVRPAPTQPPPAAPGAQPQEPAPPAVAAAPSEGTEFDPSVMGPASTWNDLYESFSEEEQSCIRNELGDDRLEAILASPFVLEGLEDEPVAVLNCISDEKAREILFANMAAQFGGLTEEQQTCLRQLLGNFSPADLAKIMGGSEPTPEQALMMLSFGLGMVACVPELAQEGGPGGPPDGAVSVDGMPPDDSRLWSFTTGGWVVTAPAVADGVVYIGSDDRSLYALTADTGQLLWSHATGDVIRSTPAIADGKVFFGSNDNHLYALDAASGGLLWSFDTGGWVQYSPQVGHGAVYLPVQGNTGQKVVALDAATGETRWTADVAARIDPRYTPGVSGNHVYVAGSTYGEFYALDAAGGEVAWKTEVSSYVESNPTVIDGVVYLTVVNHAYALSEATGEVIWSVNTEEFPARDFPALVVDGVYYLAPSSNIYALDAAGGDELWSYESGMLSTAPVVSDGVLYGAFGEGGGEGSVFALDAATGQELWKEATGDEVIQSLTATDGLLYGESDAGTLIAAAGDSGVPVWAFEKGGFSDVRGYTVKDGVVYSAGPNNSVYAHTAP